MDRFAFPIVVTITALAFAIQVGVLAYVVRLAWQEFRKRKSLGL